MHADLAMAMVRAAEAIYGPVEGVEVLSNQGHSRASLEQEIARRIEGWSEGGLILTDFWGGSCHVCGAAATRGRGEVVVVTGVNLPMLLDYLHNRDANGPAELAARLQRKGVESLRLQRGSAA
jgi:PTS system mannose-specific IIA component